MRRKENWPLILSNFLQDRAAMPFKWGQNDCMLFCSDCVLELTGYDPAKEIRGTYKTKAGAAKVIKSFGDDVSSIISAKLGESKAPSKAQRGDIVTLMNDGQICGGVVDETGKRAAFVTPQGLCRIKLSDCIQAWGY